MDKQHNKKIGLKGEDVACKFLMKQGFVIKTRNYLKKYGEIDIVVIKNGTTHFVEVKTVSCENISDVNHETNNYKPEDNVHYQKLKRLGRVVQVYIEEYRIEDWQFDVVTVFLDIKNKKAKVKMFENIVLEE